MVSGHTDRATINQRKPLTPGMRSLLAWLCRVNSCYWHELSTGEQNQLRGLIDRGYVDEATGGVIAGHWKPSNAGRERDKQP